VQLFDVKELFPDADPKLIEWTTNVKTAAHWECQETNCGIRDRHYLVAHHIEPVSICPQRRLDLTNGICLCLWHHAMRHSGIARILILIRILEIELKRLAPREHKEAF